MSHLNNEHFTHDLDAWQKLNEFDEEITVAVIPSHHAYVAAKKAVNEFMALDTIKELAAGARRITHDGCVIALDREPQPDKPGTVRRPGTRRQTHIKHTKARFGAI